MILALASPRPASTVDEALEKVERMLGEAAARGARIACFPEAYVPGLREQGFDVAPFDGREQERALRSAAASARAHGIAVVLGMENVAPEGRQIASFVIDARGEVLGCQTKNQLDPTEDRHYVPGDTRRIFEIDGFKFGIAICHEGWRYPETVRWAAARGAKVVFHPQLTGSDRKGTPPTRWGDPDSPYYEKAMTMRSIENTVFFASVNYALRSPESATALIDPSGECRAHLPYGEEGVLVCEIDPAEATGLLARRYAPARHREADSA